MAEFENFAALDIRAGTIIRAEPNERAKKPAYKLWVDFGAGVGTKASSAQITEHYTAAELVGKQVLGVVNFAPRNIAGFVSEVLILGTYSEGGVVLIRPDKAVDDGDRLG